MTMITEQTPTSYPAVDFDSPAFYEEIHRIYSDPDNIPPTLRTALDSAADSGILPAAADIQKMLHHDRNLADLDPTADPLTLVWTIMRDRYGWSQPVAETIACIETHAAGQKVLEIGAGSGYWSAVLKARGLNVVAIDNGEWTKTQWTATWTDIENIDASDATHAHPGAAILLVFPVAQIGMKIVSEMQPGQLLMTVAPEFCTGDEAFFTSLNRDFDRIDEAPTLSLEGPRNDNAVVVYIKRAQPRPSGEYRIVKKHPFGMLRSQQAETNNH